MPHKKSNLPEKDCAVCGRPFKWRKKWEKVWHDVQYCSEKCRRGKDASKDLNKTKESDHK